MTFGLRCSGPACRPHPASLPVRVPTVESLPPASFGFPLAVAPCGLATVAVIGPDWLLSSNKTLPMLGTPCGGLATRRLRASATGGRLFSCPTIEHSYAVTVLALSPDV